MKHLFVVAVAVTAGAAVFGTGSGRAISAQQPTCLHGPNESPDQATRRQAALRLTRHINTVQSAEASRTTYQPLDTLPITQGIPDYFAVHLATDGKGYAFSVKDTLDPCGFGYFSDQDGRIYVGEGIR